MRELIAVYEREHLSSLSIDRRRTAVRVLDEFASRLDSAHGSTNALRLLLGSLLERGYADGTLQKTRAVVLGFATWAWREGQISGDELLALRDVRLMGVPSREATPQPYRPSELRQLRAALDAGWPKLGEQEADRWLRRYSDGRSPYRRVRSHAIRCQLDAIISLALHLGLRRREIFALDVVMAHPENDAVVVWGDDERSVERARQAPWTDAARAAMSAWIGCRHAIAPEHDRLWLNLHAEPNNRQPMKLEAFNRVLATYIGRGWTLKRLRDTSAAAWVRAGLPPEKLRELLGLARVEDVMPYMRLVRGSLEGRMVELDEHFEELTGPIKITDLAA
jgi:integrase